VTAPGADPSGGERRYDWGPSVVEVEVAEAMTGLATYRFDPPMTVLAGTTIYATVRRDGTLVVRNPATRETREIPWPQGPPGP
jgi:hypothetical protein